MRAICFATISLMSCGPVNNLAGDNQRGTTEVPTVHLDQPQVRGDDDLLGLVYEFYGDASWRKHDVETDVESVSIVSSFSGPAEPGQVVGLCTTYSTSGGQEVRRIVELRDTFWATATLQTKRTLVYHELGHCALNLGHTPEGSGNIMDPYVLPDLESQDKWLDLVRAEFKSSDI